MRYYVLVLETENVIAKFPYMDKEVATKRFEENLKSNKFVKVGLVAEGEEEPKKEEKIEIREVIKPVNLKEILEELRAEMKEEMKEVCDDEDDEFGPLF